MNLSITNLLHRHEEDQETQKNGVMLVTFAEPKHVVSEQFRTVRTNYSSSYYKNKSVKLNYVPYNTRNRQTQERQRVARVKRVLESFSFLNLISSIVSEYFNIIPQSWESRAPNGALLQIVNKLLQKTI